MLPLGPRTALGPARECPKPAGPGAAARDYAAGERKWGTELRLSETALLKSERVHSARTLPGGFLENGRGTAGGELDWVKRRPYLFLFHSVVIKSAFSVEYMW